MPYSDPKKQREAVRKAVAKHQRKLKAKAEKTDKLTEEFNKFLNDLKEIILEKEELRREKRILEAELTYVLCKLSVTLCDSGLIDSEKFDWFKKLRVSNFMATKLNKLMEVKKIE